MTDRAMEPTPASAPHAWQRYWLATRPGFLAVAAAPALLGMAVAHGQGVRLEPLTAVATLLGTALAAGGANVLNDYHDSRNGADADNDGRLFPFTGGSRMIQNGLLSEAETHRHGALLLAAGVALGGLLAGRAGPGLLWLVAAGLFLAWAYSAPPLRLNSRGWGEVAVAVAYGMLIPAGADFVQRQEWAWLPWLAGAPSALLVTNVLYINQFPDRAADLRVGKRHWVARLSTARARWGYLLLGGVAHGWLLGLVLLGMAPVVCLLGLAAAPLTWRAGRILHQCHDQPGRLLPAIQMTIGAALLNPLGMALGWWLVG